MGLPSTVFASPATLEFRFFDHITIKIVGIFYVKDLLHHRWKDKRIGEIARRDIVFVRHSKPLDDLLNAFKSTRRHLFIVLDKFDKFIGIVTVEDVIEEIIGAEIYDEFDKKSL